MLTVEKFKVSLIRPNHPDWLFVGVDSMDDSQLYILGNGGTSALGVNCFWGCPFLFESNYA